MQTRTRFPPEPSGMLHIGHLKAVYSNYKYAKDNNGEMIIRIDDTNPKNCKQEYVNSILCDLRELSFIDDNTMISYTSYYFDTLLNYAIELIKLGDAYIDNIPKETINRNRKHMIDSPNKNNTIEQNLELFNQMSNGNSNLTLRAKINMKHKNACMRDPILYRSSSEPHYKTKSTYKIYPSYDFSCPILDSIENITDTFRTSEYSDRTALYFWILDKLNLRKPNLQLFSSLTFERTVLSKRKIKWLIENNYVTGWNDPRLCTVQGLLKRGITKECLFEYINGFYLTKVNSKHGSYDIMISINNNILDKTVPRYTVINKENVYILTFDPPIETITKTIQLHPKFSNFGTREIKISNQLYLEGKDVELLKECDEVTLLNLGNVIIKKIDNGSIIAKANFDGDFKTTKYKLTWLSTEDTIDLTINEYDHILKTSKLVTNDGVIDTNCINLNSKISMKCYGESGLKSLKYNTHVQLLRRGYCIVNYNDENNENLEFNKLPDTSKKINHLSAYSK